MTRWLVPTLALALAAAALYLLVTGGPWEGGPPLDRIDPDSRARLERVLRDAERGSPDGVRGAGAARKP